MTLLLLVKPLSFVIYVIPVNKNKQRKTQKKKTTQSICRFCSIAIVIIPIVYTATGHKWLTNDNYKNNNGYIVITGSYHDNTGSLAL